MEDAKYIALMADLEDRKKEDIQLLRREHGDILGNRTDEEVRELYEFYSRDTHSAGWITTSYGTEGFRKWFIKMRNTFS